MLMSDRLRQLREGNAPRTKMKAPKRKARRTRIYCKEYLAWMHTFRCLVLGNPASEGCSGALEAHHVRRFGEEKNDFRILPLCNGHHQTGPQAIGKIHSDEFEIRFELSIEIQILRLNALWVDDTDRPAERSRRAALLAEARRITT